MSVCWIKTISYENSTGNLRKIYDEVKSPLGNIDNVYKAHSLRPATLKGHDVLYKSILHNNKNSLPLWFLETIGVYTSMLNNCSYAIRHHSENIRKLLNDEKHFREIYDALSSFHPEKAFSEKQLLFLLYTEKLTKAPDKITKADIEKIKNAGAEDGEILEVNQTCAYFNYVNRLINGLGINLGDDVIGYY